MLIGGVALLVSFGQLVVAIFSLRPQKGNGRPTAPRKTGLARNRHALNALLIAATALAVAATALIRIEISNDNARQIILDSTGIAPLETDPGRVLSPDVTHLLVLIGTTLAIVAVAMAQRAWRGWSGPQAEARGVALAVVLAVVAGVVAVLLISASDFPYAARVH